LKKVSKPSEIEQGYFKELQETKKEEQKKKKKKKKEEEKQMKK
jgi:hypothetical protein